MNTIFPPQSHDKQIVTWLILCAAVIFCMIILGGATRLTHSGLSMVEWKPIMGVIPPLNESEWQETFDKYKQSPEYQKINFSMSVAEFKSIFYFEYFHRVLGRLIGVIFLLPFLYFLIRKRIQKPLIPKMLVMFILGGLQGLLGWYMVKSGLVKDPFVSQYRLTAHLSAAVLIYGYILWVAFGLIPQSENLSPTASESASKLLPYALGLSVLIFIMILSGGFVAGTKAGLIYNTFPLMQGRFIPENLYSMSPFWLNWFENHTTIQFNHRMIAYLLVLVLPVFCLRLRRAGASNRSQIAAHLLLGMLLIQVFLGVITLLFRVPVSLGVAHQGGAIVLFTISLFVTYELKSLVHKSYA